MFHGNLKILYFSLFSSHILFVVCDEDHILGYQRPMDSKFPLPLDMAGVKVNYHRQKICVKDKSGERCVSKNDVPGTARDVENLFRVVVEYEVLALEKKNKESIDSADGDDHYSNEYKKDESGQENKVLKGKRKPVKRPKKKDGHENI